MTEINFTKEDVGKWAFDISVREWVRIITFTKNSAYPVKTESGRFTVDGKDRTYYNFPTLFPDDHPAILAGKLEIPIPKPPKKRVVLEPGWYLQTSMGNIFRITPTTTSIDHCIFEITSPITLVEGEK